MQACAEQRHRFAQDGAGDSSACFALFERAIVARDARAWDAVHAAFAGQVVSWVRRHPGFARLPDPAEEYAEMAWARFDRSMTPDKFMGFAHLGGILRVLQKCTACVILDELRRVNSRLDPVPLDLGAHGQLAQSGPGPDDQALEGTYRSELWEILAGEMKSETEQIVLFEAFAQGRKPQAIHRRHPTRFGSAQEVSRVKENIVARLRRSARLRAFRDVAR